jgi:PASTA domain-containing protein
LISFVQGGNNTGNTMPMNGVTAGNTLVLVTLFQNYGGGSTFPTVVDSAGQNWTSLYEPTYVLRYGSQPFGIAVFSLADAAAGSHDITYNVDPLGSVVVQNAFVELSGLPTPYLDVYSSNINGNSGASSIGSGSLTTRYANEFVLAGVSIASGTGVANAAITDPPSGFTSLYAYQDTAMNPGIEVCYQLPTSTGTFNPSWSWTDATEQVCQGFCIGISNTFNGGNPVQQLNSPVNAQAASQLQFTLSNTTAGNWIFVSVGYSDGSNNTTYPSGVSDSINGPYTLWIHQGGGGGHNSGSIYYVQNISAGSPTITVTKGTAATANTCYFDANAYELTNVSGLGNSALSESNTTGPLNTATLTPKQSNSFILGFAHVQGDAGGGLVAPLNWISDGQINGTGYPNGSWAHIAPGSSNALTPNFGTLTTAQDWAILLGEVLITAAGVGVDRQFGPGVTPDKRTMFRARVLSTQFISSGKMSARGYSNSYGYVLLGQQSTLSARGYSNAYGYGNIGSYQNYFGELFRGPGISSDWPQTFLARNLATTQSPGISSYIEAYGYSKFYGRANSNVGGIIAKGYSKGYGWARVNGVTSIYGTGYSLAYGFGNGFGISLGYSNATGYSKGYGRAQFGPQTILMPEVVALLQAAAQNLLQALGLIVNVGNVNSLLTAPGLVSAQFPPPGTLVSVGQSVSITVSIGPYIRPPNTNLGYKVTSRQFSLEELVAREWGPSFRAPDHRIYEWSNGRGFDSTDIGNTGIYQKGTSTS